MLFICNRCTRPTPDASDYCPYCGTKYSIIPINKPKMRLSPDVYGKPVTVHGICQSCKKEYTHVGLPGHEYRFCPDCGTRLISETVPEVFVMPGEEELASYSEHFETPASEK